MKANLTQREPEILAKWEADGLYDRIQESRSGCPVFSFHDGPPYSNGRIHLGHALNKILKDFVTKSKTMEGFKVTYRPGWDCHGLPIELQIEKEQGRKVRDMEIHAFRRACRNYADKFIGIQLSEFTRLGVFGDWKNPYRTMDYGYEAAIARSFMDCFKRGYAYKGMKSVQWCIHCETALAEAEVEYQEHTSPTVHVKFQLAPGQDGKLPDGVGGDGTFAVIWTTTPWTLPANLAIAFNPSFNYVAVRCDQDTYIVAEGLMEQFLKDTGLAGSVEGRFSGARMEGVRFRHPFIDRDSLGITAAYVTSDTGTGCVHTAPGHGQEDYISGVKYGLDIYSPVDTRGAFFQDVEHFAGMNVFEANPKVVELLRERGSLLATSKLQHSYPHCWRCKNPLIFRATEQWFASMEHDSLRERALAAIDSVEWVPPWGRNRIHSMMEGRPDWCLSRQRRWGVPITVLFCSSCSEPVGDDSFFDAVEKEIAQRGAGIWWEGDPARFLPAGFACPKCGCDKFRQETDNLDVWFDSGVSHRAVLGKVPDMPWPSEIYLEGSDQHRGWFHTSLLTALMLDGGPPYRRVITHGFVLDGEGRAMSKSMGNVISPDEVVKKVGAEILRLWVSMVDYRDDVRFSWDLIQRNADAYLKVRNTLRFLLGNISNFSPADSLSPGSLLEIDRYILLQMDRVIARVIKAYADFAFHIVYHELLNFCTVTLSAFYLDILKDRLYCSPVSSPERRSAQTAIYRLADGLTRLMAPILPFTAEEVWGHIPGEKEPSVHLARFPEKSGLSDDALLERWEMFRSWRDAVNQRLEISRRGGEIGKSLEAAVTLHPAFFETQAQGGGGFDPRAVAGQNLELLKDVFMVSELKISEGPGSQESPGISISRAAGEKCCRCWMVVQDHEEVGGDVLCRRCARAAKVK